MVALLEEYNIRPAKTDLSPKKCSTANFLETGNRVGKSLSQSQDLCPVKEGCAYETASGHEYGPFGELVAESGSYVSENTYKFSTKPQDSETGHYYYGFRYYDAKNGRWLNRDPIEEDGGINLFCFNLNNSNNMYDLLGMVSRGELLAAGGSLKRLGGRSIITKLGLASVFISAGECILDIMNLDTTPPDCVKDEGGVTNWQNQCKNSVKSAVSSCSGMVGGLGGAVAGAVAGYFSSGGTLSSYLAGKFGAIGSLVGRVAGRAMNSLGGGDAIADMLGCDKKPKIDCNCNE